jgi:uncharacterized protein (DUF4415 family)
MDASKELPDEVAGRGKRGPGRPAGSNKSPVNLRLDQDVINAYKSKGAGWQTRMNEALRDYAKSHGML